MFGLWRCWTLGLLFFGYVSQEVGNILTVSLLSLDGMTESVVLEHVDVSTLSIGAGEGRSVLRLVTGGQEAERMGVVGFGIAQTLASKGFVLGFVLFCLFFIWGRGEGGG